MISSSLLALGPIKPGCFVGLLAHSVYAHVTASWTKLDMNCKNSSRCRDTLCALDCYASAGGSVLDWTFAFGKLIASLAFSSCVSFHDPCAFLPFVLMTRVFAAFWHAWDWCSRLCYLICCVGEATSCVSETIHCDFMFHVLETEVCRRNHLSSEIAN